MQNPTKVTMVGESLILVSLTTNSKDLMFPAVAKVLSEVTSMEENYEYTLLLYKTQPKGEKLSAIELELIEHEFQQMELGNKVPPPYIPPDIVDRTSEVLPRGPRRIEMEGPEPPVEDEKVKDQEIICPKNDPITEFDRMALNPTKCLEQAAAAKKFSKAIKYYPRDRYYHVKNKLTIKEEDALLYDPYSDSKIRPSKWLLERLLSYHLNYHPKRGFKWQYAITKEQIERDDEANAAAEKAYKILNDKRDQCKSKPPHLYCCGLTIHQMFNQKEAVAFLQGYTKSKYCVPGDEFTIRLNKWKLMMNPDNYTVYLNERLSG